MQITVIGTGYVGLVTGACFSEMGNHVTCIDIDTEKLENLKKGILPIYEPGLEPIVLKNYKEGLLKFSPSLPEAMKDSNVYFIAVGTPPGEDGSADLQYVTAVAKEIGKNLEGYAVEDFMRPDRIIIGSDSDKALDIIRKIYAPFSRNRDKIHVMGLRDAVMAVHVSQKMLKH